MRRAPRHRLVPRLERPPPGFLAIAALVGVAALTTNWEPQLPLESPAIAEPEAPSGPHLRSAGRTEPAPAPTLGRDFDAAGLGVGSADALGRARANSPTAGDRADGGAVSPLTYAPKASPPARS